jgi:hypothetical protein
MDISAGVACIPSHLPKAFLSVDQKMAKSEQFESLRALFPGACGE